MRVERPMDLGRALAAQIRRFFAACLFSIVKKTTSMKPDISKIDADMQSH